MFITYSVSALYNSGANSQGFASHLTPPNKEQYKNCFGSSYWENDLLSMQLHKVGL